MAKKTKPVTGAAAKPGGKLAGKTVAFIGKFGYSDFFQNAYQEMVRAAGGTIVDPLKKVPDYIWVGEGRGGKPPGDVAKLQKKHPAVIVLGDNDFAAFLLPSREEFLKQIKALKAGDNELYWDAFDMFSPLTGDWLDLTSADLRHAKLRSAKLERANLTDSDLREVQAEYAHFRDLSNVDFRKANLRSSRLGDVLKCNFREADLTESFFFYSGGKQTATDCDFTSVKLAQAQLNRGEISDCQFTGADLTGVECFDATFKQCDFNQANLTGLRAHDAKFKNCSLMKANLTRADLSGAKLAGANLQGADLTEANLKDADLTGANLNGANLLNAKLNRTKLGKVDLSKAKNYATPVNRKLGPHLKKFAAAAFNADKFETSAQVDLGPDERAVLSVNLRPYEIFALSRHFRAGSTNTDRIDEPSVEKCIFALVDRWPNATLRLDTVQAKGSLKVRAAELQVLAVAAWAEAYGIDASSAEKLAELSSGQKASATAERDQLMKRVRKEGAAVWNDLAAQPRALIDLRGANLSGAKLDNLEMFSHDLSNASFAGSSLVEAEFGNGKLAGANLANVNLSRGKLTKVDLTGANLTNANLTGADLSGAKLLGTNLIGVKLKGTILNKAQFDHETKFPAGFKPLGEMVWKGKGDRPAGKKVVAKAAGSLDFADFIAALNKKVELARMQKATAMLKKERFQLFSEVSNDAIGGVVKSQTDAFRVYSCRLTSQGEFGCCTQNLFPCGGLRGALCKHLLVLIIGLAKAGQLDSATVDHWINLSRSHQPTIDEDVVTATFLKYQGAEAGEIDWRPTETLPEDFYSM